MTGLKVGYASCSTVEQDVQAQRAALLELGVDANQVYVDRGGSGAGSERPGLQEALAAARPGDTLVATKLDRLARSVRDAHDIVDVLTNDGVALQIGASRYDPDDPGGRLLVNVLAMLAEFERDLIRARTREGMAIARAKGRLKGRKPKFNTQQDAAIARHLEERDMTPQEIADQFNTSRASVYRAAQRHRARQPST